VITEQNSRTEKWLEHIEENGDQMYICVYIYMFIYAFLSVSVVEVTLQKVLHY